MKRIFTALVLTLIPLEFTFGNQETKPATDAQELGRTYTDMFYKSDLDKLWEKFSPEMTAALASIDGLKAFRANVEVQLGEEAALINEKVVSKGKFQTYIRQARFKKFDGPIEVVWALEAEGVVAGFSITPARKEFDSPHLQYQTKTRLRLPFDGKWHVFWGGRTLDENYHAFTNDQRFAYDLLIMKDGKSHAGEGTKSEEYYCFGKPILAPADGIVAGVVDGIADNVPGEMNPQQPVGNHVVIDHGNGEFSFLAHLQNGSVKVTQGQKVATGDVLAMCGNSGNSSEPHLHYHLQTTAVYSQGDGLPAQFCDYVADGANIERGEPVKGQSIEPR